MIMKDKAVPLVAWANSMENFEYEDPNLQFDWVFNREWVKGQEHSGDVLSVDSTVEQMSWAAVLRIVVLLIYLDLSLIATVDT